MSKQTKHALNAVLHLSHTITRKIRLKPLELVFGLKKGRAGSVIEEPRRL